jgi:hypothetical protein
MGDLYGGSRNNRFTRIRHGFQGSYSQADLPDPEKLPIGTQAFNLDTNRLLYVDLFHTWVTVPTTGGGGSGDVQSGNVYLSEGQVQFTVFLPQPYADVGYSIGTSMLNEVDENPLMYMIIIKSKAVGSFVVKLSAPIENDNYAFSWITNGTF